VENSSKFLFCAGLMALPEAAERATRKNAGERKPPAKESRRQNAGGEQESKAA
jgi:hypothetical protein